MGRARRGREGRWASKHLPLISHPQKEAGPPLGGAEEREGEAPESGGVWGAPQWGRRQRPNPDAMSRPGSAGPEDARAGRPELHGRADARADLEGGRAPHILDHGRWKHKKVKSEVSACCACLLGAGRA